MIMLMVETVLVFAALVLAFTLPSFGANCLGSVERHFSVLARRRTLAIFLTGAIALVLRLALLPIEPIPQPAIQDEFSLLLQADTFLHGRLANPTHPMWVHFESFNIIQKPTYASIYPPGHALFLALGRLVFGHAFWGVWLSLGMMSAAVCWMLQGWISPPWAFLGALLCVVRFCTFSFWANSYMVPAASALGGALTLGALPRLLKSPSLKNSLLMGAGLTILANTRPYEGLVFSAPIAVALIGWIFSKSSPPLSMIVRRIIVPVGSVLLLTAFVMGYYNWRVTGSPFMMPHRVGELTYATVPKFLWQHPHQITFRHQVFRDYDNVELMLYSGYRMHLGLLTMSGLKIVLFWLFYLGPVFTLPLLVVFFTLPAQFSWTQMCSSTRFLLILCFTCFLGFGLETLFNNHYAAPMMGLILLLILIAMRQVRRWPIRNGLPGKMLSRAVPVIVLLSLGTRAISGPLHFTPSGQTLARLWCAPWSEDYGRGRILKLLDSYPGRQLVVVRYSPKHNTMHEWVYNDADIDNSKIVWARSMDPIDDAELLNYFKDRHAWFLDADDQPPVLSAVEKAASGPEGADPHVAH